MDISKDPEFFSIYFTLLAIGTCTLFSAYDAKRSRNRVGRVVLTILCLGAVLCWLGMLFTTAQETSIKWMVRVISGGGVIWSLITLGRISRPS